MQQNQEDQISKKSLLGTIRDLRNSIDHFTNELRLKRNILSIDDLCTYTGLSRTYVYKLTSARIISHYKPLNKTLFFLKDEIDEWILSKCVPQKKY